MTEPSGKSFSRFQKALGAAGKRGVLALELGMSDSQFSKLTNGQASQLCHLLDKLGLELVDRRYVESLEHIVRERL